jgi:hypothetical protein
MCADVYDPNHKTYTWKMSEDVALYVTPDSILMFRCYPMQFAFDNLSMHEEDNETL